MEQKYNSYHHEYMPSIVKWGRVLNLLMVPAMFVPCLYILLFYQTTPNMAAAISGSVAYISFSLPYYFTELISLGPILHVPGTYIGFCAGNTRNICAVATSAALDVTNAKTGSPEATVMATIATATSVIMKFIVVIVMALAGGWVLTIVPQGFLTCLGFLVPGMFGAMWMQWFVQDYKLGVITLVIALLANEAYNLGVFSIFPAGGEYMRVLLCVILGFVVARLMYGKKIASSGTNGGE